MKEMLIKVEGMVCGGCENRVKNALSTIEGVQEVEPNHESGIVKVITREDIEQSVIEEKIEDIGFNIVK